MHVHVPSHRSRAQRCKGWMAVFQNLPPQLTPWELIINNPFPSTKTKRRKPLEDLYMCELVGAALHDKDGSTGWVKSTWWYSFYFSRPVILLMDTGDAQTLWASTCVLISDCLWNADGVILMAQQCELWSAVSSPWALMQKYRRNTPQSQDSCMCFSQIQDSPCDLNRHSFLPKPKPPIIMMLDIRIVPRQWIGGIEELWLYMQTCSNTV